MDKEMKRQVLVQDIDSTRGKAVAPTRKCDRECQTSFLNVYLFLRERKSAREGQRQKGMEDLRQALR